MATVYRRNAAELAAANTRAPLVMLLAVVDMVCVLWAISAAV